MSTYLDATAGDVAAAVDLYRWNLDVSMALFESIHYLEVAVRNRIDEALSALVGPGQDWLDAPACVPLTPGTRDRVAAARRQARSGSGSPTHGHVIAAFTFGFWPYLLSQAYSRSLWSPALRQAFPRSRRAALHDALSRVSALRNRIAHHEPLLGLDLADEYAHLLGVAEQVEPRLGWWIDSTSRLDTILRRRPA
jgi:hypothetical protein